MKTYIGTKTLAARPMTRGEYNNFRGWVVPADENPADEGYLVEYKDGGKPNVAGYAGYVSWSPKDVFERVYHEVKPETAAPKQPIIPPFPQIADNVIQFKALVLSEGVAVHHDCGISETTIKELFTIGEGGSLHPDLVAAAMTSIQSLAAKYNGVKDETQR